nr:immunoglobulin heavy chain junction region [Mus musculus]NSM07117.1 immunoglobulin heavy chain junction region [Mus musculus]NSM08570.1 immunoglobulin heavy chain junction region [Mus musculus]NSM09227.1 immunoglobulin heavy chain junction region [Mus musculus]NSM09430.1 immunoglobulin heavy chain junction region [Mus musculus]
CARVGLLRSFDYW